MTTPDEIIVTYESSAAEDLKLVMSDPTRRKMVWVAIALFPVMLATTIGKRMLEGKEVLWPAMLGVLLMMVITFLIAIVVARRAHINQACREHPDGTVIARRFSEKGVAFSADGPLVPWGLITGVAETKNGFLISDASSTMQLTLPKRAMTEEQVARLRSILTREFQSRPKALKLPATR